MNGEGKQFQGGRMAYIIVLCLERLGIDKTARLMQSERGGCNDEERSSDQLLRILKGDWRLKYLIFIV